MPSLPEPAPAPYVPFPVSMGEAKSVLGAGTSEELSPEPAGYTLPGKLSLNGAGDLRTVKGFEAIDAEIRQVLGTRAATETTRGELPWDPGFGAALHLLRHRMDRPGVRALARTLVGDAIGRYVTSVIVLGVEIVAEDLPQGRGRVLHITVYYQVRASGAENSTEVLV